MTRNRTVHVVSLLLLFTATSTGNCQAVTVITPYPELETRDGDTFADESTSPFRSQYVISADRFTTIPASHKTIVGLTARLDGSEQSPVISTWEHLKVVMGTTDRSSLSNVFANNYTGEPIVVFEGSIVDELDVSGTGPPHPFAPPLEFTTPFQYDPGNDGNLVIEFISTSGSDTEHKLDFESTSTDTVIFAGNPDATVAEFSANVLGVNAFTFVPEPSTSALIAIGLVATLCLRWPK